MKIILTGATGYVGEGTLLELLKVDTVEKVLSVSRKPTGITHEKLEEYLVPDFMELKAGDDHFKDYDAVFFIAGITSVGTPKDTYVRISQEIPLHFADIMPDKERMTFIYLSGAGNLTRRQAVLAAGEEQDGTRDSVEGLQTRLRFSSCNHAMG